MPKQTFHNLSIERKEEIMDAICNELSRHIYEHINLSNIVREANMARGSLYQYFEDKDDIYYYFYMEIARQKIAFFGDLVNPNLNITFFERIQKMFILALKFIKLHPKWVKPSKNLLMSANYKESSIAKEGQRMGIELYKTWIESDIKNGFIRSDVDSKILAKLFYEMLNQIATEEFIFDRLDDDSIIYQVNQLIDIFKKGIDVNV